MTACGHLSQTLDGLDGARKENGGRGMEEPRASIPLDYRFLHLSFYRYKRKRKGDAEKMEAVVRGTKTIEEFKRVREDMLKRAERYSRKHIASCENWQEGLEECENYVEAFIRDREKQGFSAYTVKMEKSALAKLYGRDFDFETIATRRQDITRSRKEHTEGDKHFSETKNSELVNACRCIGFRRSELEKASAADLFQAGGFWFVRIIGKGGRLRAARIVGTDEEINRAVEYVKTLDGNNHVSSAADIHSYRADYATRVYLSAARDISGLKGEKNRLYGIDGQGVKEWKSDI